MDRQKDYIILRRPTVARKGRGGGKGSGFRSQFFYRTESRGGTSGATTVKRLKVETSQTYGDVDIKGKKKKITRKPKGPERQRLVRSL